MIERLFKNLTIALFEWMGYVPADTVRQCKNDLAEQAKEISRQKSLVESMKRVQENTQEELRLARRNDTPRDPKTGRFMKVR